MIDANALSADPKGCAAALAQHAGLDLDLADAVALDNGGAEAAKFHRPAEFRPLLRDALGSVEPDLRKVPAALREAFARLVEARQA